ncbi:phasin protein [Palleronia aestuarii]|uniref:Phasin protein n=1 Tax=Palleronia aestuarii TaxID=568105 RepID=A0A2W7MSC9_9RHOB|nr:phasin family protein [Palleronia aestuarii]PZX10381.1 phasin protein [Palleronia aestuarii]
MATNQGTKSAANDIQSLFDPQGYQNVFRTMANSNERLTQVMVETGTRSTKIFSETSKEALSNLRELGQVRDEPAAYGQAYNEFFQKQMELFMRTAQSFAGVTQETAKNSAELASEAGRDMAEQATANAESAADKAGPAAKKAA